MKEWILVNNNVRPLDLAKGDDATAMHYIVLDLKPRTSYVLRITAHNSAGSTVKEYKFSTLDDEGNAVGGAHGSNIVDSEELLISSDQPSSPLPLLFILPLGLLLLAMVGVTLCLHRKRIKQGLGHVAVHFSKANDPAVLPQSSMTEPTHSPPSMHRRNHNEYEMSASDLNYGFGGGRDGGGGLGGHGGGGRVGLHGMDTFASSCNDIVIGSSSSGSPAIFSSRKLLNDAVIIMMCAIYLFRTS